MAQIRAVSSIRKRALAKGGGILGTVVNKAIDLLPVELHLPGYNYCGPGTKLKKRLARGDKGINPLDEACKVHDLAYSQYSDTGRRAQADKELAEKAWEKIHGIGFVFGRKSSDLECDYSYES